MIALHRVFPELITEHPEPGEEQVYGAATEVIVEWRGAWTDRKQARYTLDWLRAERRRLELELRLIGVFGLTPPPADVPWGERRRESELDWRRRALRRLRWQLPLTWCLHWLLRGLTLRRWGRPGRVGTTVSALSAPFRDVYHMPDLYSHIMARTRAIHFAVESLPACENPPPFQRMTRVSRTGRVVMAAAPWPRAVPRQESGRT